MAWHTERSPDRATETVISIWRGQEVKPPSLVPLFGNGQRVMFLPIKLESFPYFTREAEVMSLRFQRWLVVVELGSS